MIKKIFPILDKFSLQQNLLKTLNLIFSLSRVWTTLTIVLMFLETSTFFYSLYCFKLLVNILTQNHSLISKHLVILHLMKIILVAFGYIIIKSLCSYTSELNTIKLSEKIDKIIHEKAISLDLEFYENPNYFDTLKRAYEEANNRPIAILNNLVEIVRNSLTGLGFLSVIIAVNWVLVPIIVLMIIPSYFVKIYTNKIVYKWYLKRTPMERNLGYLRSVITGDFFAKELRVYHFGGNIINMFTDIKLKINSEQIKIKRQTLFAETLVGLISTLAFVSCIGFIALNIIEGKNSVGDIALLLLSLLQTFSIMQTISTNISQLFQNNLFISSIFEFLDLKSKISYPENTISITTNNNSIITVNNLSFTYPNTNKVVLDNINLNIPSGKIIAIVGLNGSGKSTLIKLLTRLYNPDSGSINLDNINITNFNPEDYRNQISVVFQDFGKYNFTVGENIHLGNSDSVYDKVKIKRASEDAGADKYINDLPDKYDTLMGKLFENGHEVSIGQWQKLAIARAFYRNSKFIILDEATSAIDSLAENELIIKLQKNIQSHAVILISHRLSVIKHADYIYVLSNGKIVQEGTHNQLISIEGSYFTQFKNDL